MVFGIFFLFLHKSPDTKIKYHETLYTYNYNSYFSGFILYEQCNGSRLGLRLLGRLLRLHSRCRSYSTKENGDASVI